MGTIAVLAAALVLLAVSLRQTNRGSSGMDARSVADLVQVYDSRERQPVSDFSVTLLDGSPLDRSDLMRTVSVVNVWGSWCGPCRSEAPGLARLARQLGAEVQFLGINVRDNPAAAQAFERSFRIPYPSVHPDESGEAILAFGGALTSAAIPSTVVLDPDAAVAARIVGPVDAATLRDLVRQIASESP
jgi:thiol-disulfide isomerase/thioredoxin